MRLIDADELKGKTNTGYFHRMIDDCKTVDAVPVVHGRWIEKEAPAVRRYFECSNCGAHENKHTAIKGYYCWRCGAKMDESMPKGGVD